MANKQFNPEEFRVKFRAAFAVLGFIAAMLFIFVAVLSKDAQTSKYTGTIIGFMTGTLVTLVFTYYFGSADGSVTPPPIQPDPPDVQKEHNDLVDRENALIEKGKALIAFENHLNEREDVLAGHSVETEPVGYEEDEDSPPLSDEDEFDEEVKP